MNLFYTIFLLVGAVFEATMLALIIKNQINISKQLTKRSKNNG